ncbi:MAG: type II toxin-antitoxin system VapB family antitoxin [Bifidobacteriaceae bacterium]|jgi:hypothetical protein|nr:type II toxin-antitoxin system VapB family antitoxin [Bifidobacteriaceae bacterium]
MRTTLMIDDDLYREVKVMAAKAGRTVGSLVEEALADMLAKYQEHHVTPKAPFRIREFQPTVPGTLPGVDLTCNALLEDIMDGLA